MPVIRNAIVGGLSLLALAAPSVFGDEKPKEKKETLEQLLQEAPPPASEAHDAAATPGQRKVASATNPAEKPADKAANPAVHVAAPAVDTAPPTDDNDGTTEAARPAALQAVKSKGEPRHRGPFELGPLDCRVLDGAGIERMLPKKVVAGEEPDLLCRVVVTQPPTVMSESHQVTLTVNVGPKETFRQVRKVRMSSIGRRALVFVIPADKVASYDAAEVRLLASLSPPALPGGGREVKFVVEPEESVQTKWTVPVAGSGIIAMLPVLSRWVAMKPAVALSALFVLYSRQICGRSA